jgi:purine-binding chemotaxis protein CheW
MNAWSRTSSTALVAAPQATADRTQYLTFMLGGEVFAIGILVIKEIIEYSGLTSVPMMPDFIRGVINLRGAVVPVMDLMARFGKQAHAVTKRTCIVIVEIDTGDEQQVIGVIVDAVNAVVEIAPSEIEPAPSFGARIHSEFIEGMGKVDGGFIILLNVNQVLSNDQLDVVSQAAGAMPESDLVAN